MPQFLWTQTQDVGPKPRRGHAVAFDAARSRMVLLGGKAADSLFNDTWEWDGENWTQVQDIGPTARWLHAMAYDAVRQRTVLFGGVSASSNLNDTWDWNGKVWTQVADSGPQARSGHAMTFDGAKIVLFGGESAAGLTSDTWEWNGQEWTQQQDIGPSARRGHAMASSGGRTLLFGGAASNGSGLGDTWEWDGQEWTQQQDIGPDACVHPAMASTGASVILFGGVDSIDENIPPAQHTLFGRTWEWDGQRWTQVQDMGPRARWLHTMTSFGGDDVTGVAGKVVLFGGLSLFAPAGDPNVQDALLGDTWENEIGDPSSGSTVMVTSSSLDPPVLSGGTSFSIGRFTLSGPFKNNDTFFAAAFRDVGLTQGVTELSSPINPGDTQGEFLIDRNPLFPPGDYTIAASVNVALTPANANLPTIMRAPLSVV